MTSNRSQSDDGAQVAKRPRLLALWCAVTVVMVTLGIYLAGVAAMSAVTGITADNFFWLWTFLAHIVLGAVFALGLLVISVRYCLRGYRESNWRKQSVWAMVSLLLLVVFVSGAALFRVGRELQIAKSLWRPILYGAHVVTPVLLLGLVLGFRRSIFGQRRWGLIPFVGATALGVAGLAFLHEQAPRTEVSVAPVNDKLPYYPALARTASGDSIPAAALMRDAECKACHADVHADWQQSAHHFSSFNNPVYLAAALETRADAIKKHGNDQSFRFCAGCHDPVPLFSNSLDAAFADPQSPVAQAGLTCTACHAITEVANGAKTTTRGNADYTIAQPREYPLAGSDNGVLSWLHRLLLLTKPAMHKQTFLKPVHKTPEFCGTCHKVHLPEELNDYKFVRGQNHYDSFVQSGVSGYGARSFYYPPHAAENCATCHMPPRKSDDLGATDSRIRNHLFPAANTGLPALRGAEDVVELHRNALEGALRVDLFGIREAGRIDGPLHAPLRPELPVLKPGATYLLEAVIRNLLVGHHFTQGTADSNQIWLDIRVTDGTGNVIGRSGALDDDRRVDPWAHFVNAFVVDRQGNRISRRNAQDIFVPLYNHQIPPGAAQTVHYNFTLPEDVKGPVTVDVRLRYRKFDRELMEFVSRDLQRPELAQIELPIVDIAEDQVEFAIEDSPSEIVNLPVDIPVWQRWNDFGIGLLLNGQAELRQAESAFRAVQPLEFGQGSVNLVRVLLKEGRLTEAAELLAGLNSRDDASVNWWTLAWLNGVLQHRLGNLEAAETHLRRILETKDPELAERGFDFSRDYVVLNQLGEVLFDRARLCRAPSETKERERFLRAAAVMFQRTLQLDSENVVAHHNLSQLHKELGDDESALAYWHNHLKYKTDDSARGEAIQAAREKYPAANHAAGDVVIYDLQRPGGPGRDAE